MELCRLNSHHHAWTKQNKEFMPKNTILTVMPRSGNVRVCYCIFFLYGIEQLHIIKGKMNGALQQNILTKKLLISVKVLKIKCNWVFQQNNPEKFTNVSKQRVENQNTEKL